MRRNLSLLTLLTRSREVLGYLTCSPLNFVLRDIIRALLRAGAVDSVLCVDTSNEHHSVNVNLISHGRNIVSLVFEKIARHWGTDIVDQTLPTSGLPLDETKIATVIQN